MSAGVRRWEYGSEFDWPRWSERPSGAILPEPAALFASGRDAIAALMHQGRQRFGWRRWFLPSYFCPEVAAAVRAAGIETVVYDDSPCRPAPVPPNEPFRRGDVFFLVNYFGLRTQMAADLDLGPAVLVEDHTHDPWSPWARTSRAAWCIASLRKTLPISDGAALWSPQRLPLPPSPPITSERYAAALAKQTAMGLKRLYLDGGEVDKQAFRRLQMQGEERIAGGAISGISPWTAALLPKLPWDAWRASRIENFRVLSDALANMPVLVPAEAGAPAPLAVVLQFDRGELRDRVRAALIAASMYPAVHWPMPSSDRTEAAALSRRLLSLPCDFRYGAADLQRVAAVVRESLANRGDRPPQEIRSGDAHGRALARA